MYALNNVTYFDSFGEKQIQKKKKKKIVNKYTVETNIFTIQVYDSVMCWCFCIGFIDFMLKSKTLTDCNLFSPNNF